MIIGLTGGIASGKTEVSRFMEKLGAEIIDADRIAHQVLQENEEARKELLKVFGEAIINNRGDIDRGILGELVFSNLEEKKKLEEIVHPIIIKKIKEDLEELKKRKKIIILDLPLLYEAGLEWLVDEVWVVYCDEKTQRERLQRRDGLTIEQAQQRIASQLSLSEKCRQADRVINNSGSKDELRSKIIFLWRDINED
ncbi:MAG TPA: dephospho-CoA kinase [Halanaerobiales bacterium]|nr:dephospho-CoA kinase [Halanaerobiales bacterium]